MKEKLFDGLIKTMEKEFGHTTSFASIEDLLKKLELQSRASLSQEEKKELERLESLPLEPKLEEFFRKQQKKRL